MPRSTLLYLEDIRNAIAAVRSYVGNRKFEGFVGDPMCLDAVVLRLITIGEAVKHIPAGICARHPEIAWRKISGLHLNANPAFTGMLILLKAYGGYPLSVNDRGTLT